MTLDIIVLAVVVLAVVGIFIYVNLSTGRGKKAKKQDVEAVKEPTSATPAVKTQPKPQPKPAPVEEKKEEPAPVAEEKVEEPASVEEKKEEPVKEEKLEEPAPVVEEEKAEEPAPVVEEPVVEEKVEEPAPVVEEEKGQTAEEFTKGFVVSAATKTFEEQLAEADDKKKDYYNEISNYALNKTETRVSKAKGGETYICGRFKVLQILFQRGKLVCKFMTGSSDLKKYSSEEKAVKIKEKPVIVEIDSDEAVAVAKNMIDIAHRNIMLARNKKVDEEPAPKKEEVKEEVVETASEVVETAPVEEAPVVEEKIEKTAPAIEEKPVAKTAPKKKAEPKPATPKHDGKWVVEYKGDNEYMSKLVANNGEVMLSSEIYSTEEGARSGIATIVKNTESGNFIIYRDKSDKFYYKLKNGTNRLLCVGEIYKTKDQCLKAVESVKRMAGKALVVDKLVEGEPYVAYTPEKVDSYDYTARTRGKWVVEMNEDGRYTAKLFASNGQLMLATEEVAQKTTALKAIESVKKNSAEGNFIIDKDKFGRFYYKLRNAQKSVICIGEAYEKLDSCTSALESVRRFAATAVLTDEEVKPAKSK